MTELRCRVPEEEREQRRQEIVPELRERMQERRELEDGYGFGYPNDSETLELLTDFIISENECCPFFRFELEIGRDDGPVWLRLRGSEKIKQFIEEEYEQG